MTSAACEVVANNTSAAKKRWIAFPERDAAIRRLRRVFFPIVFGEADPPKIEITSRRGRCCRRWGRRTKIKLHRRWPLRAFSRGEEWSRRKTKHTCDQIGRETAHRHIVVLHSAIEITAFDRNSILGSFQLRLQTKKTLIGF